MIAPGAEDLHFLEQPGTADAALAALPAAVAAWFRARFGAPTPAQRLAWLTLAAGRHLLLSAPTGTGKTLAAFLPVVGDLLTAPADGHVLRCLYVAPLKALANDIARSMESHLADLQPCLPPAAPRPRLAVRTGDTPAEERRRLRDDPPELLLTTPESLAVLLSQPAMQGLFADLRWAVIDEVHALAGNKRGADLAVSLERLTALAGEGLRRVGLSATATPLGQAARYLAGVGRACVIARAGERAPPEINIEPLEDGHRFFGSLRDRLCRELPRRRATLVFTNTRYLAERLAWALRRQLPAWDDRIAVHHSALAAERRRVVEARFKAGELRAVVTSTSLELGVDIGAVDLAVLVHPPGDVVRLLQRVGRSGHGPTGIRRGLVLTATAAELLEATVTAASGLSAQCEPLRLPAAPLDVLCQQILGMAAARPSPPDELYELVRRAAPYANLCRGDFDDCLAYLRGLDRAGRPWLPARLREDGDCFRIRDSRTARLLRRNLGSILADDAVSVVTETNNAACGIGPADDPDAFPIPTPAVPIGEVSEAFADRLQPGDRFLLDGRCLEVRRRAEGTLRVDEVPGRPRVPHWGGDGWPLASELARRLYRLRVRAAEALREGPAALMALLGDDYGLPGESAATLAAYFQRQECLSEIPDEKTLLVEVVIDDRAATYYLHTPLNRPGNDALARVAVARLAHNHGRSAVSVVADLGLALQVRGGVTGDLPAVIRGLLSASAFGADLDTSLAESPALRERFQRVVQTGLMLLRNPLGGKQRVGGRDWGGRRLFEQVRAHDSDFVFLRQAAREVRADLCDSSAAFGFAQSLPGLAVRCRWLPRVSPFVEAWTQPAAGAAESVETPEEALRRLHATLTGGGADARAG
jgi:ATP-dependent Lhr-like helicase